VKLKQSDRGDVAQTLETVFRENLCDASWYGRRYFNWPAFGGTAIENNLTAVAAALLFVFWSILRNARDNQGLLYIVAKYPEGEIIIIIWFTTEVALLRQERVWARARKKCKAPAKRKLLCVARRFLHIWCRDTGNNHVLLGGALVYCPGGGDDHFHLYLYTSPASIYKWAAIY
jgi:hypothetical protein